MTLRWSVAAILVMAAFASLLIWRSSRRNDDSVIASLDSSAGSVQVVTSDGHSHVGTTQLAVHSGDTVRTRSFESTATLLYPDGTRLVLVGDTAVTCADRGFKSVIVHHGTLAVSAQTQPPGKPMVLATPAAQVEVLGTQLLVEAFAYRTRLSVTEGRVRMARLSDGKAIEVGSGEYGELEGQREPLVQQMPNLAVTWEANFESGLPTGWGAGEPISEGLPEKAGGAVRSERGERADGTYYMISSNESWVRGLFAVRRESHLHVTYKMENPDWVNVLLVTRTSNSQDPQFSGNYLFNELPLAPPGQWQTVSIPLTKFKRIHPGNLSLDQVVPYVLTFSAPAPDRGLVIDRVWVTPDGPGSMDVQAIPAAAGPRSE